MHQFSKGGSFYIVSELCAKGTLKDMYEYHLKECSYVPEDEAWRILSQILQAFLFIHGEKVLHRYVDYHFIIIFFNYINV